MLQQTQEPENAYSAAIAPTVGEKILPEPKTEAVERLLTDLLHKAQKKRRRQYIGMGIYLFACLWPLILGVMFRFKAPDSWGVDMAMITGASYLLGCLIFVSSMMSRRIDFEKIAEAVGVSALPTLLTYYGSGNLPGTMKSLRPALIALMWQVKASDTLLFSASHRALLRRILNLNGHPRMRYVREDFFLSALQALGQIGDEKAIPSVERLANRKARNARQERLKQAALETLPLLRQRAGETGANATLLRAADAHIAQPETLLRASTEVNATPADELLRPRE